MRFHHASYIALSLVLGTACGRPDREPALPEPAVAPAPTTTASAQDEPSFDLRDKAPVAEDAPKQGDASGNNIAPSLDEPLGDFKFTYYWVANENGRGPKKVELIDQKCRTIAKVSPHFRRRLNLEGSGRLRDGRLVNKAGNCKCGKTCFWVAGNDNKWGLGVAQRPLSPFRSIAVDTKLVNIGDVLYVAELDGLTMPGSGEEGGFVHDGCVIADDRGGGVKGKQLDFFAARKSHYRGFFKRHKLTRVSVYAGGERCKSLDNGDPRGRRVASNRNSI